MCSPQISSKSGDVSNLADVDKFSVAINVLQGRVATHIPQLDIPCSLNGRVPSHIAGSNTCNSGEDVIFDGGYPECKITCAARNRQRITFLLQPVQFAISFNADLLLIPGSYYKIPFKMRNHNTWLSCRNRK